MKDYNMRVSSGPSCMSPMQTRASRNTLRDAQIAGACASADILNPGIQYCSITLLKKTTQVDLVLKRRITVEQKEAKLLESKQDSSLKTRQAWQIASANT